MRLNTEYQIKEIAGEKVIVIRGKQNVDMTKLVAFNESSIFLWNELSSVDFELEDVANKLCSKYGIDKSLAINDATKWIEQLKSCGLLNL